MKCEERNHIFVYNQWSLSYRPAALLFEKRDEGFEKNAKSGMQGLILHHQFNTP